MSDQITAPSRDLPSPGAGGSTWRDRLPETTLAVAACAVFLGFLGSVEVWGKREQRAAAEALDTVDRDHWLVAEIQGRPRLEKPPLPRWTIAALVRLTGRRDEWVVRLPGALAALGMVGLTYGLGRRIGGRPVGLASGLALTSLGFFVAEVRQAGNDAPLAFFTTLALYAAWRRLHGEAAGDVDLPGRRSWSIAFHAALGLGFLCKGPVVLALVAVALVPYFASTRSVRRGVARLADGWGLLLLLAMALAWPVAVALADPNAVRVWWLEIGQKTGVAGFDHLGKREILAADWPALTAPWVVLAVAAVVRPLVHRRGEGWRRGAWFAWWWAVGGLGMFCLWSVAKPNYYLPCLPGVALLVGHEWVELSRAARRSGAGAKVALAILRLHWAVPAVAAVALPVAAWRVAPQFLGASVALSLAQAAAVGLAIRAWRRGADAGALAPLVGAWAAVVLVGYGAVLPSYNSARGHRELAEALNRVLPPEVRTVMFFHEIDEGLWFYLQGRDLAPVPGSQPRYNDGLDFFAETAARRPPRDSRELKQIQHQIVLDRQEAGRRALHAWLDDPGRDSPYVLLRARDYERLAPHIGDRARPVHCDEARDRGGLILLEIAASEGGRGAIR